MKNDYPIVSYENYMSDYQVLHPFARVNHDKTEVIITHANGGGSMNRTQVSEHVKNNWYEVSIDG